MVSNKCLNIIKNPSDNIMGYLMIRGSAFRQKKIYELEFRYALKMEGYANEFGYERVRRTQPN